MKLHGTWFVRALLYGSLPLAVFLFTGCSSTNNQFAGSPQLPVDVAHFQVGDTVTVTLVGPLEVPPIIEEAIKEDGTITMPNVGKIQAVGKTAGQLQDEIYNLYVPAVYKHLNVTVKSGDRVYYVKGAVGQPGRQIYVGQITVSKAITSAGDFNDFANHRNVLLIRANGQRIKVNVDKAITGKAVDPQVYPGDQIVVSRTIW